MALFSCTCDHEESRHRIYSPYAMPYGEVGQDLGCMVVGCRCDTGHSYLHPPKAKPETVTQGFRRRVNVASSVKGVLTFDATVEVTGETNEAVLAQSDGLVRGLRARYPNPEEQAVLVMELGELVLWALPLLEWQFADYQGVVADGYRQTFEVRLDQMRAVRDGWSGVPVAEVKP